MTAMRVLFLSPVFAPSRGGIETVVEQVATGLSGIPEWEIRVATETSESDGVERPFSVHRWPDGRELRELFRWADVVWQHQVCFAQLIRARRFPRKMGATFHTWLPENGARAAIRRLLVGCFGARYGVSRAIGEHLPSPHGVLPNSFAPATFNCDGREAEPQWDFIAVGRLVPDKGFDDYVCALGSLRARQHEFHALLIGEGPELGSLQRKAEEAGLGGMLEFQPWLEPAKLADLYRRSRACVVPSRWREPFGLVALEAIACGAQVIAPAHGGLPEVVGPCGRLYRPHDQEALTQSMLWVLEKGTSMSTVDPEVRAKHLSPFRPDRQIAAYRQAIESLVSVAR